MWKGRCSLQGSLVVVQAVRGPKAVPVAAGQGTSWVRTSADLLQYLLNFFSVNSNRLLGCLLRPFPGLGDNPVFVERCGEVVSSVKNSGLMNLFCTANASQTKGFRGREAMGGGVGERGIRRAFQHPA